MPRVPCAECGIDVVVDPTGRCPEGHRVRDDGPHVHQTTLGPNPATVPPMDTSAPAGTGRAAGVSDLLREFHSLHDDTPAQATPRRRAQDPSVPSEDSPRVEAAPTASAEAPPPASSSPVHDLTELEAVMDTSAAPEEHARPDSSLHPDLAPLPMDEAPPAAPQPITHDDPPAQPPQPPADPGGLFANERASMPVPATPPPAIPPPGAPSASATPEAPDNEPPSATPSAPATSLPAAPGIPESPGGATVQTGPPHTGRGARVDDEPLWSPGTDQPPPGGSNAPTVRIVDEAVEDDVSPKRRRRGEDEPDRDRKPKRDSKAKRDRKPERDRKPNREGGRSPAIPGDTGSGPPPGGFTARGKPVGGDRRRRRRD